MSDTADNKFQWTETSSDLNAIPLLAGSQPMALDVNGDQAMDLLY